MVDSNELRILIEERRSVCDGGSSPLAFHVNLGYFSGEDRFSLGIVRARGLWGGGFVLEKTTDINYPLIEDKKSGSRKYEQFCATARIDKDAENKMYREAKSLAEGVQRAIGLNVDDRTDMKR